MKLRLIVTKEADADIREAVTYYLERNPGLEIRFLSSLDKIYRSIMETPTFYPKIGNSYKYPMGKFNFPHSIYYRIVEKTIYIFAVFHPKRNSELIDNR